MEALVYQRKSLALVLVKKMRKIYLSVHYNDDKSYLFINGKEIFKFKSDNKNVKFPTQFCLGSISNGFRTTESKEVSLNGNLYNFSVDYNFIDKSYLLNIRENLMNRNNINNVLPYQASAFIIVLLSFSGSLARAANARKHVRL